MHCCERSRREGGRRGWRFGAGGCAGSGLLLALLPKCPLCLAAYLGLWMGAEWAGRVAREAKPALLALLAASAGWLAWRAVMRAGRLVR